MNFLKTTAPLAIPFFKAMSGGYFAQQQPQEPGGYFNHQPSQMSGGYFQQQAPQSNGGYFKPAQCNSDNKSCGGYFAPPAQNQPQQQLQQPGGYFNQQPAGGYFQNGNAASAPQDSQGFPNGGGYFNMLMNGFNSMEKDEDNTDED